MKKSDVYYYNNINNIKYVVMPLTNRVKLIVSI